jgi:aspartyl-tRNA(Asn)/glutamyl-tRNA(Gln) amidotransferase subunit A
MYLTDIMTVGANITGHPAISVPVGEDNGLPVGMQIIAPQKADRQLLLAAKAFEGLK